MVPRFARPMHVFAELSASVAGSTDAPEGHDEGRAGHPCAICARRPCTSRSLIEQHVDGDRLRLEAMEVAFQRVPDGAELGVQRADTGIVAVALKDENAA